MRELRRYNIKGEWYGNGDTAWAAHHRSGSTSLVAHVHRVRQDPEQRFEVYMPEQVRAACSRRVLVIRDPMERIQSGCRLALKELPDIARSYEEYVNWILAGHKFGLWLPFTDLFCDEDGYLPTEHVRLQDVADHLPLERLNVSAETPPFNTSYRYDEVRDYYAADVAIWEEINDTA